MHERRRAVAGTVEQTLARDAAAHVAAGIVRRQAGIVTGA